MKLTIWQFVALVVVIIIGYLIYDHWWVKQDQNSWIRKMNGVFTSTESKDGAE
jgi:hypothetical protein